MTNDKQSLSPIAIILFPFFCMSFIMLLLLLRDQKQKRMFVNLVKVKLKTTRNTMA